MPPKITVITAKKHEVAKLRVAAYARVSSDSDDQLNSYVAQVDYYTILIKLHKNYMMILSLGKICSIIGKRHICFWKVSDRFWK